MLQPKRFWNFALALALCLASSLAARGQSENSAKLELRSDWRLQSSCEAKESGEQISEAGFPVQAWHRTDVPSTVVGTLVTDKTYPDPYYGVNLRSFPGMNYSNKTFFGNQEMPADSPFRCSWWYRTEFSVPTGFEQRNIWLHFLGINYRANVWINGRKIADAKNVAGTFRAFEFDVTKFIKAGESNALAVEVFAPKKDDLAITWVDWNPTPPDKNMGLWKEAFLTARGDVAIRQPFVSSKLDSEYKTASLTISAELRNESNHSVNGVFSVSIDGIELSEPVALGASEARVVGFTPDKFPELRLAHPRLWWPYQMGVPSLYSARLSFEIANQASDSASVEFGIREVTSELTHEHFRLFKINGRKVLIRGAAWAPDMLLRWSPARLDADLGYVRDLGLNTIRLEGSAANDEFFEKTDRLGILVMPGWACCDMWERRKDWTPETREIAGASLETQILRLRNHPSVFVWLYGSDGPPPVSIEKMYLDILKKLEWPNPALSSASQQATTLTGRSGVKMTGPYEYVPPVYWLADKDAGGAWGYNTETSPGPAIPPRESLERFIPSDHLWPIDDVWNSHAGGERFTTIKVFANALNQRYGTAQSLNDFLRKSQAMTYEGQRAMFEAYARDKYRSTGVIQWMLNNAWPSIIWHLYDYYLVPAGGYFGTKMACEPVHVQYSYDDNSVAVINGTYEPQQGLSVSAKLYNLDAKEKGSREATINLAPDSSTKAFDLPKVEGLTTTYFIRLQLQDSAGKLVSDNFYWLSTKPDVLDWKKKQDTVYTPQSSFGDLTGLEKLPEVKLTASKDVTDDVTRVTVSNTTDSVAFMVHLRLTRGKGGEDVTPILWGTITSRFCLETTERCVRATIPAFLVVPKALWSLMDGTSHRSR